MSMLAYVCMYGHMHIDVCYAYAHVSIYTCGICIYAHRSNQGEHMPIGIYAKVIYAQVGTYTGIYSRRNI